MSREEVIGVINTKLENKKIFIITCESFLPKSFALDMQKEFGINPETDIVSNVYWGFDEEGACTTGALAYLGDISRAEAFKKIEAYGNDKQIEELHVLALNENGVYAEYYFQCNFEGFDENSEILVLDEPYPCPEDLFGIYIGEASVGFVAENGK